MFSKSFVDFNIVALYSAISVVYFSFKASNSFLIFRFADSNSDIFCFNSLSDTFVSFNLFLSFSNSFCNSVNLLFASLYSSSNFLYSRFLSSNSDFDCFNKPFNSFISIVWLFCNSFNVNSDLFKFVFNSAISSLYFFSINSWAAINSFLSFSYFSFNFFISCSWVFVNSRCISLPLESIGFTGTPDRIYDIGDNFDFAIIFFNRSISAFNSSFVFSKSLLQSFLISSRSFSNFIIVVVNSVILLSHVDLILEWLPSDLANLSFNSSISFRKILICFSCVSFKTIISFVQPLFCVVNSVIFAFNRSISSLLSSLVFSKLFICNLYLFIITVLLFTVFSNVTIFVSWLLIITSFLLSASLNLFCNSVISSLNFVIFVSWSDFNSSIVFLNLSTSNSYFCNFSNLSFNSFISASCFCFNLPCSMLIVTELLLNSLISRVHSSFVLLIVSLIVVLVRSNSDILCFNSLISIIYFCLISYFSLLIFTFVILTRDLYSLISIVWFSISLFCAFFAISNWFSVSFNLFDNSKILFS